MPGVGDHDEPRIGDDVGQARRVVTEDGILLAHDHEGGHLEPAQPIGPIGGGTDGPISKAWNVRGWPTIYVLDHKGVIRYRDVREKQMDEAVDALLQELEQERKKSGR